jgi:hypothetical protein
MANVGRLFPNEMLLLGLGELDVTSLKNRQNNLSGQAKYLCSVP